MKHKRKKLKSYFRYHHFKTIPVSDSHSSFIGSLSALEQLSGIEEVGESDDIEGDWDRMREAINDMSDEDIKTLYRIVENNKDNY